ncbi:MAG: nicotinate (nicotinamide) nucleotide adenylyltransferase [Verrucomicrobiae bacterium]|nr:nicotinate (nicotinamide) nucleotide adenylyltransferase [Verrucomicrobiae bacterium]
MDQNPQRIALFGGTFDPVHNGHLDLAKLAFEKCGLDQIVFIPCARSPFKTESTLATSEQRFQMLELAIADLDFSPNASVSRFEIDREPPSYSWQTAAHFRERCPGSRLFWILGADQWEQIDRWAEPEKLRTWLDFIVVTRHRSAVHSRHGWNATFLEFEHPASATAIREGHGGDDWLPVSVVDFIRKNRLYSFDS